MIDRRDSYTAPRFERAALITIDVQCDTLEGKPLEVKGTSDAVPKLAALASCFRMLGKPIVHVVRIYEPDGSNVDLCRRARVENGEPLLLRGSPGAELAPTLAPTVAPALDCEQLLGGALQQLGPREAALYKPRWGAFYGTSLEEHLRNEAVDTLVIGGCNFPNCPRTTIYEASERDFRVVAVGDAISGLYQRGLRELEGIGVIPMAATEIIAALKAAHGRGRGSDVTAS